MCLCGDGKLKLKTLGPKFYSTITRLPNRIIAKNTFYSAASIKAFVDRVIEGVADGDIGELQDLSSEEAKFAFLEGLGSNQNMKLRCDGLLTRALIERNDGSHERAQKTLESLINLFYEGSRVELAEWDGSNEKAKTAAVLSFKGPRASHLRKDFLLCSRPGTQIHLHDGRELWLHFTGTYRHLGAVYCADGVMTKEVHVRIGAAGASFQQLKKIVFGSRRIRIPTRLRLLDALISSKLTYGLSTWSSLGVGLLNKVEAFMLRCQRYACAFRTTGTHDEFRGQFDIPSLHHRMMKQRHRHMAHLYYKSSY